MEKSIDHEDNDDAEVEYIKHNVETSHKEYLGKYVCLYLHQHINDP